MAMKYVLPIADGTTTIYCPYHRVWEVYLGEDPALCEWCCMPLPCPMHGDQYGHGGSGLDVWDEKGLGFDPFQGEDDMSVAERIKEMRSRFERRKEMRKEVAKNPPEPPADQEPAKPVVDDVDDWIEIDTL